MVKKKKRKLKKKKLFVFFLFVVGILFAFSFMMDIKINNVIVRGNILLDDYEVIKLAKLDDYPSSLKNLNYIVRKRLLKSPYVKKAKVYKTSLTKVVIEIKENLPLFYYLPKKKTVLSNKTETDDNFPVPTVVNYIPDKIYLGLVDSISNVDYAIVKRISEIKYDPNEVDDERFLLTMNDGNYVYLTLEKFSKINKYLEIIKSFDNKKGTLYLDSGEYFEVR